MAYDGNDASPTPSATGQDTEYKRVMDRYKKAKGKWNSWSDVWEEIYDFYCLIVSHSTKKAPVKGVRRISMTKPLLLVFLSLLLAYSWVSFRQMAEHLSWHRDQSFQGSNKQAGTVRA